MVMSVAGVPALDIASGDGVVSVPRAAALRSYGLYPDIVISPPLLALYAFLKLVYGTAGTATENFLQILRAAMPHDVDLANGDLAQIIRA